MLRSFVRYYSDPKTNKILTQNLDRGAYSMLDENLANYTYSTKDAMLIGMYDHLLIKSTETHFLYTGKHHGEDEKDMKRENFLKVVISAMNGFDTV
jgi:hypothetical protein